MSDDMPLNLRLSVLAALYETGETAKPEFVAAAANDARAEIARLTAELAAERERAERVERDCGILLAHVTYFEEATGETLDPEDGADLVRIREALAALQAESKP